MIDIAMIGGSSRDTSPLVYWSFGVAALSLIWTIGWSWWTFNRSLIHGYWFSEVVAPNTVEPLLAFSKKWLAIIRAVHTGSVDEAADSLSKFGEEKDEALHELWLSELLFDGLYDAACSRLDEVEDNFGGEVGKFCLIAKGSRIEVDFDDVARQLEKSTLVILRELMHAKVRVRRHPR